MRILVERKYKKSTYTIGRLSIDGAYFCDTLEDKDRGLNSTMSVACIRASKIAGKTAIPTGKYDIDMDTISPRFSKQKKYQTICAGKLPRLRNVPAYEGCLIHIGNFAEDTEGCLLVGRNTTKGAVMYSTDTFKKLYNKMALAHAKGERITIEIV